jgi:hypothetical protein
MAAVRPVQILSACTRVYLCILTINPTRFMRKDGENITDAIKKLSKLYLSLALLAESASPLRKFRVPRNTVGCQWARQFLHESVSIMKCRKAFKLFLSVYLGTVNFKFTCFMRVCTPPEARIIPNHSSRRIKCRLATENQPPLNGVIISHIFMNLGQVYGFRVLHSP